MLILSLVIVFAGTTPLYAVDTDNFIITDFKVDMRLSRDEDKRSVLKTTETITAQFPDYDQNHGLEKVFVREYDNHSTSLKLESVTDQTGRELSYHWAEDALRIGDADTYVHGQQIYKITYTQRDVTKFYKDTDKQEFYWDAIGVEWRVPIRQVNINLQIDESIRSAIETDLQCYAGYEDQNKPCLQAEGQAGQYVVNHDGLAPNQGVTIALGFTPGTFSPYQRSLFEILSIVFVIMQIITAIISFVILCYAIIKLTRSNERTKDIKALIPEYLPPKDSSVTTASQFISLTHSVMAAQLIDLAVRHYIKLYQVAEKKLFSAAEYEIEIIKNVSILRWEERELLSDMFGNLPKVGDRFNLKKLKNNTSYYNRTLNNDKDLRKLIRGDYGLRQKNEQLSAGFRKLALGMLIAGMVTLSIPFLLASLIIYIMSFVTWQLTDKGLELKQYLLGLKYYIEVAEEERIKLMQSPEGAERRREVGNAGKDVKQRLVLYEKLLPYAMLFGQEKQWNAQLGKYYEQTSSNPSWYAGHNHAFSAAAFASGMSDLRSATTSASSSSSSSGGPSGGGSSGGGGGGGGGGGW